MPFTDDLPASGTKPWYTPFNTAWTNLKAFVNGLETEVSGVEADITDLQSQIDALEPGGPTAWVDITGKPASFPPSAHTQAVSTITGLQAELDAKALASDLTDFETTAGTALTNLSTEVGTKATQASVNALSDAQSVMAGNLDSTFALASEAKTDADAALAALPAKANTADVVPNTRTVAGKALSSNVSLVKADVGLGAVDNTADSAKPVSTAQQAALDLKANTSALPPRAAVGTVGYLGAVWILNGQPVPTGLPADTAVITKAP